MEDEANEIPVADPKPPGTNSFLDMDEDDEDGSYDAKDVRKKSDRKALPPYDTSAPISVNFSNKIIGATVRPGAFLSVPGGLEDPSEAFCDHKVDLPSLYDRIVSTNSDFDAHCSPYDGVVELDSFDSVYDEIATRDSESELPYLAKPPRSPPRCGVSDSTCPAGSLHVSVPPLLSRLFPDGRVSSSSVIRRCLLLREPV